MTGNNSKNSDDQKLPYEEIGGYGFDDFDKDGDGMLTLGEYEALWIDAMRERMVDRFQDHDANGDGKVTAEEFGDRFADMVKFMDTNGDGILDESDMRRHHDGQGYRRGMRDD